MLLAVAGTGFAQHDAPAYDCWRDYMRLVIIMDRWLPLYMPLLTFSVLAMRMRMFL